MEVKINITKSRFFTIIGVMLLVGAAIVVQGQGSSSVPNPGHSVNEIDWTQSVPTLTVSGPTSLQSLSVSSITGVSTISANTITAINEIYTIDLFATGQIDSDSTISANIFDLKGTSGHYMLRGTEGEFYGVKLARAISGISCSTRCDQTFTFYPDGAICLAAMTFNNGAEQACSATTTNRDCLCFGRIF